MKKTILISLGSLVVALILGALNNAKPIETTMLYFLILILCKLDFNEAN